MYAEVTKGLFPVLNANVSARVSKPDGDVVIVSLKDNGKGIDKILSENIKSLGHH